MGAYLSQPTLPNLSPDVIQSIIAQASTSTILEGAIYVNKQWNEIGRRNAIWIPRYKQLTGIDLTSTDFAEYEVFPLFLEEWFRRTPIWLDELGRVDDVPEDVEWIDSMDPTLQSSYLLESDLQIENHQVVPVPGNYRISLRPVTFLTTKNRQWPELFKLIRKSGFPVQVKALDFYTITSQNDLLEDQIMGFGSFNCAILTDRGDVVRISNLERKDAWTLRAIPRGAAIVHLFNEYQRELGPSLLIETGPGVFYQDIPEGLVKVVCTNLLNTQGPYFVQRIEHLNGGYLPDPADTPEAVAFCLVWFLHVAQMQFNFRHGDLKIGNIIFRRYSNEGKRFTFRYNDRYTYSYVLYQIPVIIDYDFAAIYGTRKEDRLVLGTSGSVPPEALWVRLNLVMGNKARELEYDDWWSLGIVLFQYWTRINVGKLYTTHFAEYAKEIWTTGLNQPAKHFNSAITDREWMGVSIRRIFDAYLIVRGIYPENEMPPPLPKIAQQMYSGRALQILQSTPRFRVNLSNFQVRLLRQLLSWEPWERGKDLLTRHFSETMGYFPDFSFRSNTYMALYPK